MTFFTTQKSYDIEEITYMSERYDSAKTQRLNELEGLLGQYRVEIDALRTMMTAERTRALQDRSGQQVENMPAILQLPTGEQIKASLVDLASAKIDLIKSMNLESVTMLSYLFTYILCTYCLPLQDCRIWMSNSRSRQRNWRSCRSKSISYDMA